MAKTDAEHLEQLKLARDAITEAIIRRAGTVEYRIGGRQYRCGNPDEMSAQLAQIKKLINEEESAQNQDSSSARNLAKLTRRP